MREADLFSLRNGVMSTHVSADLNYMEKSGGGPVLPLALLPKSNKVGRRVDWYFAWAYLR